MKKLVPILLMFLIGGCSEGWLSSEPANSDSTYEIQPRVYDDVRPEGAEGEPVFAIDISKWAAEITDADVACWYEAGVRHIIVGTQTPRITVQQLEKALEGGMSVDAYAYLYWSENWSETVREDLELLEDYPIGRFWLDVEDHPGGTSIAEMEDKIQDGLDACGDTPCGIYTASWWWEPHMRNRDTFSHVPLWHAYYDEDPALETWSYQKFGGWERPWGKQWTETYFCGLRLDKNTMFINAEPVTGPKEFIETEVLAAPQDLYPNEGVRIDRDFVRALSDLVPGADRYEFEVESYANGRWAGYYTFRANVPKTEFTPVLDNRVYRFRVRAQRGDELSPWSNWSHFTWGRPSDLPEFEEGAQSDEPEEPAPEEAPEPEPEPTEPEQPTEPEEPEPQAVAGAPVVASPADRSQLPNGAVTLEVESVDEASSYAFEIEFFRTSSQSWGPYYTYQGANSRRFYPQADKAYRWRAVATTPAGETPASAWYVFTVGSAALP